MSEQITIHPKDIAKDEQTAIPERTQTDYDEKFDEIAAHAEKLGLTPEETAEALADYAATLESGEPFVSPESDDNNTLSVEDVIADPNKLMEHLDNSDGNPFEGIEQNINKLIDDVDGLAESMRGLGETFNKIMEMLQELVKLLKEIVEMTAERETLETQEEKDEMTRKIQQKVDEFGNKYGG